jgi:hypothetical protein
MNRNHAVNCELVMSNLQRRLQRKVPSEGGKKILIEFLVTIEVEATLWCVLL